MKTRKPIQEIVEVLVVEHCCSCGVAFGMTRDFYNRRQEDGQLFYCPAGHNQYYTRREKLEAQLKELKGELREAHADVRYWNEQAEEQALRAATAKRQAAAARGQVTKIKKRVGNGYCPCCSRMFVNLGRHMAAKHPDYQDEEAG